MSSMTAFLFVSLLLELIFYCCSTHLLKLPSLQYAGFGRCEEEELTSMKCQKLRMAEEEDGSQKSVYIFGRDISQIPCFRNSFLYGIGGGLGVGTLAFLGTSRTRLALNIGFGTFFCGTIAFWFNCRYKWSQKRFEYSRLQAAARKQAILEGTDLEKEVDKKK